MIKELFEGFCEELKALFDGTETMVLRDSKFKKIQTPAHMNSWVVLSLRDSSDSSQLSGGVTQQEWNWGIKVYFYDPNADLNEDDGVSMEGYNLIDKIIEHLNNQVWLSTLFQSVVNTYAFKLTYNGTIDAEPLTFDGGMMPGKQMNYSSISLDTKTAFTVYSDTPLEHAYQLPINKDEWALDVSETALSLAKTAGSNDTFDIETNLPWLISCNRTWLTLSAISGKNNATITVTATANPGTTSRTANVTIQAPGSGLADLVVTVTQLGT
jgi:hypothetical protein